MVGWRLHKMNYQTLKTELQDVKYSGMTDSQATISLNTVAVPTKQAISSHSIRKYLTLVDKLIPMESSILASAIEASRLLDIFADLDVYDVNVKGKLTLLLDQLIADVLIDSSDKTTILAMGDKLISRADELKLGSVREYDVRFARSL